MDWKEAIAHLKSIEGTSEALGILEGEVNRLTNANFELVGELRSHSSKFKEKVEKLQSELDAIASEKTALEMKYKVLNERLTLFTKDIPIERIMVIEAFPQSFLG